MTPGITRIFAIAVALSILPSAAVGLERRKQLLLHLMIDVANGPARDFGTVASILKRLRQGGHACRIDDYTYGINIDCGDPKSPDILIGLTYAPTRYPEFVELGSLRIHGKDGGEVPATRRQSTIGALIQRGAKTP